MAAGYTLPELTKSIIAQDPYRVEFGLEREIFGAGAGGVENLEPHDRRDPEPVVAYGLLEHRTELAWERERAPPRGCVRDEGRVAAEQLSASTLAALLDVAGEPLDLRQGAAIEPVWAAQTLREEPQPSGALVVG